jgi:hypothetical protein
MSLDLALTLHFQTKYKKTNINSMTVNKELGDKLRYTKTHSVLNEMEYAESCLNTLQLLSWQENSLP